MLHPSTIAFCDELCAEHESEERDCGSLLLSVDAALDGFGIRQFFSTEGEGIRYGHRGLHQRGQEERELEGVCADCCGGDSDGDSSERLASGTQRRTSSACDARSLQLPVFKVQLIGRRDVGQRRVWDLSVPSGSRQDVDSFTAAGVVVHNCFFVGNDFLPHLPSLEIREGAIERLVGIYRKLLPGMGGYIASNGELDMSRVDLLLSELGTVEDSILKTRKHREETFRQRDKERNAKIQQLREERAAAVKAVTQHAEQTGMRALGGGKEASSSNSSVAQDGQQAAAVKTKREAADSVEEAAATTGAETKKRRKGRAQDEEKEGSSSASEAAAGEERKEAASLEVAAPVKVDGERQKKRRRLKREGEVDTLPVAAAETTEAEVSGNEEKAVKPKTEVEDEAAGEQAKRTEEEAESEDDADAEEAEEEEEEEEEDAVAVMPSPLKETLHITEKLLTSAPTADPAVDFAAVLNDRLKSLSEPAGSEDAIRFGEEGWKDRYYAVKMKVSTEREEDLPVLRRLFSSYSEGLSWVMLYYYRGCASWSWYFPFHYAPMASDLRNLDRFKQEFALSAPFSPIGQLLGVLPSSSAHCVPEACRELMLSPASPIADFYPADFPLDLNGKKYLWQAVALLPWIDEQRLLAELRRVEPSFSAEERERNSVGDELLFVHTSHRIANTLTALHLKHRAQLKRMRREDRERVQKEIDHRESGGLFGFVAPYHAAITPGATVKSSIGLEPLVHVPVVSCVLHLAPDLLHRCQLLDGLVMPPPVLTERDLRDSSRGGRRDGQPRLGENAQFMANQEHWQQRTAAGQSAGGGSGYSIRMLNNGAGGGGGGGYGAQSGQLAYQPQIAAAPTYAGHAYYDQFLRASAQQQQDYQQAQAYQQQQLQYPPPPPASQLGSNRAISYPPYAPPQHQQLPSPYPAYYAPPPSQSLYPPYPYSAYPQPQQPQPPSSSHRYPQLSSSSCCQSLHVRQAVSQLGLPSSASASSSHALRLQQVAGAARCSSPHALHVLPPWRRRRLRCGVRWAERVWQRRQSMHGRR